MATERKALYNEIKRLKKAEEQARLHAQRYVHKDVLYE